MEFKEREVLRGIDLHVSEGEIFGLLGPSGAGKTTLIKILTGQLRQTGGKAILWGRTAAGLAARYVHGSGWSWITADCTSAFRAPTIWASLQRFTITILLHSGTTVMLNHDGSEADAIAEYFRASDVAEIHSTEPDLETVFMELTGRGL